MELNIGLFNESFPPVMDGVAVCVQNYAYWMQKKVGGVFVITPNMPGADYGRYDYEACASRGCAGLAYPCAFVGGCGRRGAGTI